MQNGENPHENKFNLISASFGQAWHLRDLYIQNVEFSSENGRTGWYGEHEPEPPKARNAFYSMYSVSLNKMTRSE